LSYELWALSNDQFHDLLIVEVTAGLKGVGDMRFKGIRFIQDSSNAALSAPGVAVC